MRAGTSGWVLWAVDNLRNGDTSPDAAGSHSLAKDLAEQPLCRDALLRTLAMHPRQRDSTVMTMRAALPPWMRPRRESTGE